MGDYHYDYENRLTKVTTPDANLSFNYCSCPTLTGIDDSTSCGACADSPSGKRISKTVNDKILYTICFDPTMDFDENGGPKNPIAKYMQNPTVLDEPISIRTNTGTYYYLFDGLGSVTGLTDSNGNLVSSYSYDAFGNIVSETGDTTLNSINPYRFTSRVYDKESGLYYYRARYYDSRVGRFTQKDPLRSELREGNNLYVYCENNPVNRVDPSGLWSRSWVTRSVLWWTVTIGYKIIFSRQETHDIGRNLYTVAAIVKMIPKIGTIVAGILYIMGSVFLTCYELGGYMVMYNLYIWHTPLFWCVW